MLISPLIVLLIMVCNYAPNCHAQLILNLTSRGNDADGALKWITYCLKCPDPRSEGSILPSLNAKYGVDEYSVTGELVYCVPNYAEGPFLANDHQLSDRIAFVDRGEISLLDKVLKIQEANALGVVIADDGSCYEDFHYCGPRAGSLQEGGFAAYDNEQSWLAVEIPVVMVTSTNADRLRDAMGIKSVYIPGLGRHNITEHIGEEEHERDNIKNDEL
ncbi:hypothetical protein EON65_23030 [archaeon]|nr:MAG: hypothetical protein EON65_23030 [archaeon]